MYRCPYLKGTNGLNIALLKVGDVEHYPLGRVTRLNGPIDLRPPTNLVITVVVNIILDD